MGGSVPTPARRWSYAKPEAVRPQMQRAGALFMSSQYGLAEPQRYFGDYCVSE